MARVHNPRNGHPPRVTKPEGFLSCGKCGRLRLKEDFHIDSSNKYGRTYWCKECACLLSRKHHKENRANNPVYKEKRRDEYCKRKYGLSLEQYIEKLALQDNVCAICGVELLTEGSLTHLDHNHTTGEIRAFLCTNCNRGLGHFKDNIINLEKAINYLKSHSDSVDVCKEVIN